MEDKESVHLKLQDGTSATGEAVRKGAGPIQLMDNTDATATITFGSKQH